MNAYKFYESGGLITYSQKIPDSSRELFLQVVKIFVSGSFYLIPLFWNIKNNFLLFRKGDIFPSTWPEKEETVLWRWYGGIYRYIDRLIDIL